MGRDKARLRVGGRTLLQRSGDAARALGIPVRVIRRDHVPRCGPLGGVCTALQKSSSEVLLFLSCDMPCVRAELLKRLLSRLTARRDAVFVESEGWLGFPFAIRARARETVWLLQQEGRFSLQSVAEHLQAVRLRVGRACRDQLLNVNTPEAWNTYAASLRDRSVPSRRAPEPIA
jgi:molybdopterin-guanine dinucleotide biosynthesis protein A